MGADARELGAVCAAQAQAVDLASPSQVRHSKGHHCRKEGEGVGGAGRGGGAGRPEGGSVREIVAGRR